MFKSKTEPVYGAINVSLAVFWSKPYEEQVYKEISYRAATNTAAWSESLDINDRLWLVDRVETMALYGENVVILEQQGEWLKVAAVSQATVKNRLGYPGWVLADQISINSVYLTEQPVKPEAVIFNLNSPLFGDPALTKIKGNLGYQTRLPVLMENNFMVEVCLPDGDCGYISRSEIKKTTELSFSCKNIVQEARRFLDLKYIWGGTSSYGFDCSGFMFRLYQSQGIFIPRDASEQAGAGTPVPKENLSLGDLLFFASDQDVEKIHHVGMFIGEGLMIHSPNSKSQIRIEPFEAGVYGEEYWGARRYYRS